VSTERDKSNAGVAGAVGLEVEVMRKERRAGVVFSLTSPFQNLAPPACRSSQQDEKGDLFFPALPR
jgi:hypothetical protein